MYTLIVRHAETLAHLFDKPLADASKAPKKGDLVEYDKKDWEVLSSTVDTKGACVVVDVIIAVAGEKALETPSLIGPSE